MKEYIMNRVIWALVLLSSLILASCDTYKIKDGKVYFVHFNEGTGYSLELIPEADAKTFVELDNRFGHDAKHAWFENSLLKGINGASFRTLGYWYATDDCLVFRADQQVEGADPSTFVVHTYYFAEDSNDYYWEAQPLHVADKSSFVLMGNSDDFNTHWAKDSLYAYFLQGNHACSTPRMKIADYESFHPINAKEYSGYFAVDKYQVYFMDTIVVGADPATFQEVEYFRGKDKDRTYHLRP